MGISVFLGQIALIKPTLVNSVLLKYQEEAIK